MSQVDVHQNPPANNETKEVPAGTSGPQNEYEDDFEGGRDPNSLNDRLKIQFEDAIGEPDGYHSGTCVWNNSYFCFSCSRKCLYKLMAYIFGVPLAIYWGFMFAFITFWHVWYITPCLKCFNMNCECMQKFFHSCVDCCGEPVTRMLGNLITRG